MKIRIGTFETNSSSTHAIVIPKNCTSDIIPGNYHIEDGIPTFIIYGGEYGWEYEVYNNFQSKLNYILQVYSETLLELDKKIVEWTKDNTKTTIFWNLFQILSEGTKSKTIRLKLPFKTSNYDGGYVDHQSVKVQGYMPLMEDKELLKKFLLSSDSLCYTANDNKEYGFPFDENDWGDPTEEEKRNNEKYLEYDIFYGEN